MRAGDFGLEEVPQVVGQSWAVLYRSEARLASIFWQIRSSSLGDRVVDLPGRPLL